MLDPVGVGSNSGAVPVALGSSEEEEEEEDGCRSHQERETLDSTAAVLGDGGWLPGSAGLQRDGFSEPLSLPSCTGANS